MPEVAGMRVLLSGASGFLGRQLSATLQAHGASMVPLRRPESALGEGVRWDPRRGVLDPRALENFDAIVHLAGEPVAALRWTRAHRDRILHSRVDSTRLLVNALQACARPPHTLLCASGINLYGDCGKAVVDESWPAGEGFLPDVCQAWEAAAQGAAAVCRVALLRIGVVLGSEGGLLPKLLPLYRMGLGGVLVGAQPWLSWISLRDFVSAAEHLLGSAAIDGAINMVAPAPVTQQEFSRCLASVLHRPALVPVPAALLRCTMGQVAEETVLSSVRAVPRRLLANGFSFRDAEIRSALEWAVSVEQPSRTA